MLKTARWCMLGLCMAFANAHAAVLQVDGSGDLTGANGVDVGGTLYDVRFVDGTCISIFSGCDSQSDFTFTTLANATLASQALLDQVFIDSIAGQFDTSPQLTIGCENIILCDVWTPYRLVTDRELGVFALYGGARNLEPSIGADFTLSGGAMPTFSTAPPTVGADILVWAVWSPPAQSVPEPSAFALLGVGLLALGLTRRRRKKA